MTNLSALALRARTALVEADTVTLLIHGVGRVPSGAAAVVLHERDGSPAFVCESGSPVPRAARRGCAAVLVVSSPPAGRTKLTVVATGTLSPQGVEHVDGVHVDVVGLRLNSVAVQLPVGDGDLAEHEIPLELYRRASPDAIRCCAARIVRYTNDEHGAELRRYAARSADRPEAEILAASLARLDGFGARLDWVGADGAHSTVLTFPSPALDQVQLAARLRASLEV